MELVEVEFLCVCGVARIGDFSATGSSVEAGAICAVCFACLFQIETPHCPHSIKTSHSFTTSRDKTDSFVLSQYLLHGKIDEVSGLPTVSLEQAQGDELKEGMTIGLASTPIIPCTVAFSRGSLAVIERA